MILIGIRDCFFFEDQDTMIGTINDLLFAFLLDMSRCKYGNCFYDLLLIVTNMDVESLTSINYCLHVSIFVKELNRLMHLYRLVRHG